ncbi:alpha/beta fold hydrolase [Fulvimarina sp. 2208YS6-2-32]|uniref:Alpha/beta fold hydrolase n=1 Tax=Fulvimarina uroteuthidis TaxID=3098149 RepID=A0ABU5I6K5_9HYPH|nr:alpha/beta fold hydrolase [Fulvimarina sp. 2208YS6-2-32]MDY8111014.1 alpha/beta fold hydrolase [Fulvimarina sp. 2208YS6-2-32]
MRTVIALVLVIVSVLVLELSRSGVAYREILVGETPVTAYATDDADGPRVVIAHGFAGSSQMMQGYALPLAKAGYRVFSFDFLGHGRNPVPMSGDVTAITGTTRLLVDQTSAVIDAVKTGEEPVALIGHSMATDILARVAAERPDIGPVVLISAFSQAIDATHPQTLLLVPGAWEPGLRAFALDAARMVDPAAAEDETVAAGAVIRRAQIAPLSEHVSVLHSRVGRAAAVEWLDDAYGRTSDVRVLPTGLAILGLFGGLVLLFSSLARWLPDNAMPSPALSRMRIAVAALLPAIAAPLIAVPLDPQLLPVLVADYLALHLAIFGVIQLGLIKAWKLPFGRFSPASMGLLIVWCALFGFAFNRYAANFWPTAGRLWIILAIALGAVPYMLADAVLTHRAGFLRRLALRGGFVASLGLAVALDFEGLFFLIMIAPVVILFYLIFGTMGRAAGTRAGAPASGLALGLVLAWALGVSFPLFQS